MLKRIIIINLELRDNRIRYRNYEHALKYKHKSYRSRIIDIFYQSLTCKFINYIGTIVRTQL